MRTYEAGAGGVRIRLVRALLLDTVNAYRWSPAAKEAHMVAVDAKTADPLQRIRSEFLEIPCLHLTKPQVQRLCGLDPTNCDALLKTLIDVKFLKCTDGAQYVRADASC